MQRKGKKYEVEEKVKQNKKRKEQNTTNTQPIWYLVFFFRSFFSPLLSFTLVAIMRSHISNVCSRECLCARCTTVLEYNRNSSRVFFFIPFFLFSSLPSLSPRVPFSSSFSVHPYRRPSLFVSIITIFCALRLAMQWYLCVYVCVLGFGLLRLQL